MTTITSSASTPAAGAVPATSTPASGTPDAAATLNGDFTMFLKMLTTQLQNQDPLKPMDSTEFTQQLVSYSQVEQQIKGNDQLAQLTSLLGGQSLSQAAGLIGSNVTVNSPTSVLGSNGAGWNYNLGAAAATATLTITDQQGNQVAVLSGPTAAGVNRITWDGTDSSGRALPPGAYNLSVNALTQGGDTISSSVVGRATVQAVNFQNGQPMLDLGGTSVAITDILSVSPAA